MLKPCRDNAPLFQAILLLLLAAMASTVLAFSNREVYSKSEVDYRINGIHDQIEAVHNDVRWIMREMGRGSFVAADKDSSASQRNSRQ